MPVLAFPVPQYTTLTSTPAPFSAEKRALSSTSPGSSDSTSTTVPSGLLEESYYLTPENGAVIGALDTPAPVDRGWLLRASAVAGAGNGLQIAEGTWTFAVHYSRPGGLLRGNVTMAITAILLRVSADATGNLEEIGRTTGASITVTTTEQSQNISISGAATELAPDENLALVLHAARQGGVTTDTTRVHTNSTTALRITAAPAFARVQFIAGTSAGSATASGAAAQTQLTVGAAAGSADVAGAVAQTQPVTGSADGTATVQGSTARVLPVIASAAGTSNVDGIAAQIQSVIAQALGESAAEASAAQVQAVIAEAQGEADVQGSGGVVVGAVASSQGAAEADGRTALVIGTVGTINVGQGGGGSVVVRRPVFVYDGI